MSLNWGGRAIGCKPTREAARVSGAQRRRAALLPGDVIEHHCTAEHTYAGACREAHTRVWRRRREPSPKTIDATSAAQAEVPSPLTPRTIGL